MVTTRTTIKGNTIFFANEINNSFIAIFCGALNVFFLGKICAHTFDDLINVFCHNCRFLLLSTQLFVITKRNGWDNFSFSCKF
ncbi:hypothetical protein D3C87_1500120 [compost metagenome]